MAMEPIKVLLTQAILYKELIHEFYIESSKTIRRCK